MICARPDLPVLPLLAPIAVLCQLVLACSHQLSQIQIVQVMGSAVLGAARRGAATQIAAPDQCARTWANRSTFSRQWTTVVTLPLQTLMLSSWLATLRRRLACARSMTPSTSPSILQCSQWPTLWACLSSSLATAPRVCDDGRGGWWHCSSQNLLQGRLLGQRATTNPRCRMTVFLFQMLSVPSEVSISNVGYRLLRVVFLLYLPRLVEL